MQLRPVFLFAFASTSVAAALAVACGSDDPATEDTTREAGADGRADEDATAEETPDGTAPARDAGSDATDATAKARDANGPGARDAECAFNFECQSALRCDCRDFPCTCQAGVRGSGVLGAVCDAGALGFDCASALCVEGNGGAYYCSDACEGPGDCKAPLPLCTNVALVGKICARQP